MLLPDFKKWKYIDIGSLIATLKFYELKYTVEFFLLHFKWKWNLTCKSMATDNIEGAIASIISYYKAHFDRLIFYEISTVWRVND